MATFAASVEDHVLKSKEKLMLVFQYATDDLFQATLLPRGEGGNMRVDTGFLRSSFRVSIDAPILTLTEKPPGERFSYDVGEISLKISGAELGDVVYGSFGAKYAIYREYGTKDFPADAFVRIAAGGWQDYVNAAVRKVEAL